MLSISSSKECSVLCIWATEKTSWSDQSVRRKITVKWTIYPSLTHCKSNRIRNQKNDSTVGDKLIYIYYGGLLAFELLYSACYCDQGSSISFITISSLFLYSFSVPQVCSLPLLNCSYVGHPLSYFLCHHMVLLNVDLTPHPPPPR